jgi:hypothetical protein
MPNGSLGIDGLLRLNAEHSRLFRSEDMRALRERFRRTYQLEVSFLKCMDGRLNVSVITEMPIGLIQPWRAGGAKFDLGDIGFRDEMVAWYEYAKRMNRACLVGITYHFSRGDKHRGCAAHDCDVDRARTFALGLKQQFIRVFGRGAIFYPVLIGIETDLDALVLHGDDETVSPVDLSDVADHSPENIRAMLEGLYPGMPLLMLGGFAELVAGNLSHVRQIRLSNRPIEDVVHGESVMVFGRGADWFHAPNRAIIVGPFGPELRLPIRIAARLLLSNLNEGRISKDHGVVLMASAPYREPTGYDRPAAIEKARFLQRFAFESVIREDVPELLPYLHRLTTVLDWGTRRLEVLERTD